VQKVLYRDNLGRKFNNQNPEIFTAHIVSITPICVHPHTTIVTGALDPVTSHLPSSRDFILQFLVWQHTGGLIG